MINLPETALMLGAPQSGSAGDCRASRHLKRAYRHLSLAKFASRLGQHSAQSLSQIRAANEDNACRYIDGAEVRIKL